MQWTWTRAVWAASGVALLAGMIGALASGGFLRFLLTVELACAAAILVVISRIGEAERVMGGSGYGEAMHGPLKWLHAAITVLYNVGLMVVVFALLVRVKIIGLDIAPAVESGLPFFLGLFILLLGVAGVARIQMHGGTIRSWATQAHGVFVLVVLGLVALATFALLLDPELTAGDNIILRGNDLPILVLVAVLGITTQMFLIAGLPTTVELAQSLARSLRGQSDVLKEPSKGTPPIVYAGVLGIGTAGAAAFLLSYFDVFSALGGFRDDRVIYLVAAVPLTLVFFFLFSAFGIWREGRRGLYTKKVTTKVRNDILVYGFSGIFGLITFGLLVGNLTDSYDSLFGIPAGRGLAKDLTFLTIVATTGPIGYYLHRQNQRIDNIEDRLADFLNDLSEQRRAGLTLAAALKASSKVDYGDLSPEVKKMAHQVGWGIPFNDALKQFGERLNTSLVKRSVSLVIEASRTGGSVAQILKAAARDAYELKGLEAERRTTMMTFVIVLYVVFFVFLVVLASIDAQFLPQILAAQEAQAESSIAADVVGVAIDRVSINYIYFNAAMIQAMGNGLVAGVLSEGRVTAGFRHTAIMAVCGWVIFRLLLSG